MISVGVIGKDSAWVLKYSMRSLRRALRELSMRGVEFEVVYVDGGSRDESKQVVREILGEVEVVDAPNTNIPEARNLIVRHSSYDYVVFWDSDILAPPHALLCLFKSGRDIVSLNRRDVYVTSDGEIASLLEAVGVDGRCQPVHRRVPFTVFCVSLYKREVFKKVGLFDVRMTQAEDREFGLRAKCAGFDSYIVENVVAYDVNKKIVSDVPVASSLARYFRGFHKKLLVYAYTATERQKKLAVAFWGVHAAALASLWTSLPLYLVEAIPAAHQVRRYKVKKGVEMWIKALMFYTGLGLALPLTKFFDICKFLRQYGQG